MITVTLHEADPFYFAGNEELAIIDVETNERRSIPVELPYPLSDESFALASDGTAIHFGAERIESRGMHETKRFEQSSAGPSPPWISVA